jgi:hypothetical protein
VRACLDRPPAVEPSRRPKCGLVDVFVHAPASGRLTALPFAEVPMDGRGRLLLDVDAEVGDAVTGPEEIFSTVLAEVSVIAKDVRRARALAMAVLRDPPVVEPPR